MAGAVPQHQSERRRSGWDMPKDHTIVKLFSGDCYVTDQSKHMLVTILGSCVSACIRDPKTGVGGMNHFLLPRTKSDVRSDSSEAARYGAFAMEQLINGLLQLGAVKSRLEVKVFGGGNVIDSNLLIGSQNIQFVREYLLKEGLLILSSDLGGTYPRRIHYFPDTGKVMMRNLQRSEDKKIVEEEKRFAETLANKPIGGDVDLF